MFASYMMVFLNAETAHIVEIHSQVRLAHSHFINHGSLCWPVSSNCHEIN